MKQNFCGLVNSNTPKVCCEDLSSTFNKDSLSNHENFHLLPMDICGPISHVTRITEGGKAKPREFPWMALIAYKTGKQKTDCRIVLLFALLGVFYL